MCIVNIHVRFSTQTRNRVHVPYICFELPRNILPFMLVYCFWLHNNYNRAHHLQNLSKPQRLNLNEHSFAQVELLHAAQALMQSKVCDLCLHFPQTTVHLGFECLHCNCDIFFEIDVFCATLIIFLFEKAATISLLTSWDIKSFFC